MILSCPNCSARFLINAAALAPAGREVRCGRCPHQWFAAPPPPEPPEVDDVAPEEPAPPPPPLPPPLVESAPPPEPRPSRKGANLPVVAKQRRMSVATIVGWVLLALVVIAAGVAVAERESIMTRFPQTRSIYGAVGFATPPLGAGLAISDESCSRTTQENLPVLVCEGRLRNTTKYEQPVPALRGALLDANGRELQAWTFTVATDSASGANGSEPLKRASSCAAAMVWPSA
jgi:predicted Zn finger-like uncharacterized protein